MAPLFLSAMTVSFILSAVPGAVAAEAVRRSARGGHRPIVLLRIGALGGSLLWARVVLLGAGALARSTPAQTLLTVAGAALTLSIGWRSVVALAGRGAAGAVSDANTRGALPTGLMLALANPWQLVFWLGMGGNVAGRPGAAMHAADLAAFVAGFATGHLLYTLCFVALLMAGRKLVGGLFPRLAHACCSLTLGYSGLRLLLGALPIA